MRVIREKVLEAEEFVNPETGEVVEVRRTLVFGPEVKFAKVFPALTKSVCEDPEIAGKSIRLLFYVMEYCLKMNDVVVPLVPEKVARDLKVTRATFYRWLSTLIRKKLLVKVATNIYVLNPEFIARGNLKVAIKKFEELKKVAEKNNTGRGRKKSKTQKGGK